MRHPGPLRLIGNIFAFALLFSLVFFLLHAADFTRSLFREDPEDLGGIPCLYSAVCLIFSILAGFVIQHEWDQWNNLLDAVKGEVSTLRSLWLWPEHVPNHGMKLKEAMRQYVMVTIRHELKATVGFADG